MTTPSVAVGVDLGGTHLTVALVARDGQVAAKTSFPTPANRTPQAAIDDILRTVAVLVGDHGMKLSEVLGIGVAMPGPMSMRQGRIFRAANLSGWNDVPLRDLLQKRCQSTVTVENDGNAAAFGEYWVGAGNDRDLVMLTLGTGVGAGVILDGKILHGHFENAGELGHTIVAVEGLPCPCGQRGCLEQYASAAGMTRRVVAAIRRGEPSALVDDAAGEVNAERVVEHARRGDSLCQKIWDEACLYLAVACVNIQHAYNPEIVLLGGGMSAAGAFLLDAVRAHVERQRWLLLDDLPKLLLAKLGNDAGVIGAAGLVWRDVLKTTASQ